MASAIEAKFQKAVYLVRNGPPDPNTSNDKKLKYYALYKQANEGDVKGSQPFMINFEARAKWDAWNKLKGMPAEEAMQKYVDLMAEGDADWQSHPALADYKPS